jgi:hypothetical protein
MIAVLTISGAVVWAATGLTPELLVIRGDGR